MEYKGMTIRQSKNGNIIVIGKHGELSVISNKGHLNDDTLKDIVDKAIHFPESEE